MRTKQFVVLFSLFLVFNSGYAKIVNIEGNNVEYANTEISFYTFTDFFSNTETLLASCNVDSGGNFSLSFDIDETTYIFSHLGIFQVFLYAEPGKNYEVVLPPRRDKRPAEKLNPFFKEEELHLAVKNTDKSDLNTLIRMFDDFYRPYYSKYVISMFSKNDSLNLESAYKEIDALFGSYKNEYFKNYIKYKTGYLKLMAIQYKTRFISENYFKNTSVLYNNTAYMNLFNQVYDKYFVFYGRTEHGKRIYNHINKQQSYQALRETLEQDSILSNDTIFEMVVLKNIHDEFYSDKFSRSGLLAVLDTIILNSNIHKHKEIALVIKQKITRLLKGYEPPAFDLQDVNGKYNKLTDFKGKYVYLNFCSCNSYTCLQEFVTLNKLYETHKDRLVIISIIVDDNLETMKMVLENNKYSWLFLSYKLHPEIIKEYDIRAYPTYFLIDPEGKLVLSPAPSPNENFVQYWFNILKERGELQP